MGKKHVIAGIAAAAVALAAALCACTAQQGASSPRSVDAASLAASAARPPTAQEPAPSSTGDEGSASAEAPQAPAEGTDSVGPLTSRKATFEPKGAVSAADRETLADMLGAECAAQLVPQLSASLEERGLPGVGERDVMVAASVERDGEDVAFTVLATTGNDRVVLACKWNGATSALEAEVLA